MFFLRSNVHYIKISILFFRLLNYDLFIGKFNLKNKKNKFFFEKNMSNIKRFYSITKQLLLNYEN
jgi:hypothetical protein